MRKTNFQIGQTLVTLLVFSVIALATASASVAVMINISKTTSLLEGRIRAKSVAESGIENALIRLIRDPDYAGETLEINGGSVTVTVTGTETRTVDAVGSYRNYTHRARTTVSYVDNRLTVTDWQSVY